MVTTIPEYLKEEYPFTPKSFKTPAGDRMSFLDEGVGPVIVMLHGNPTWSFYYRNLVKEFSQTHRCIVPDHIGCGLSDKPQDYNYTLKNHIDNVEALLNSLGIKKFSLIVHDWGGAIGMGLATRAPEKIEKVVLLNTAAFPDARIPARINFCKLPFVGEKIVRHLNGFAWPATFMAASKPLSKTVKAGYLLPYNNYQNRIATHRFVKDIPMKKSHPTYAVLEDIGNKLQDVKAPKLILWGGKDFCFNKHFYDRWCTIYPDAEHHYYDEANHYVVEDAKSEVLAKTREFLSEHL